MPLGPAADGKQRARCSHIRPNGCSQWGWCVADTGMADASEQCLSTLTSMGNHLTDYIANRNSLRGHWPGVLLIVAGLGDGQRAQEHKSTRAHTQVLCQQLASAQRQRLVLKQGQQRKTVIRARRHLPKPVMGSVTLSWLHPGSPQRAASHGARVRHAGGDRRPAGGKDTTGGQESCRQRNETGECSPHSPGCGSLQPTENKQQSQTLTSWACRRCVHHRRARVGT